MFFHLILGTWENSVTFHQKVRLVNPNDYNIEGAIVGQVCNDETCQRKKQEFKFFKESAAVALQDTVPVLDGDTEETLAARVLEKEHILYPRAIELFVDGRLELLDDRHVRIKE